MKGSRKFIVPALILVILTSAGLYLGAQEQKQPQAKTQAEYDAYMAVYKELTPATKVDLATKFLTDFPDSEFKLYAYQMLIDSHSRQGNPAKVIEVGEKFLAEFPQADNNTKKFVLQRLMGAYQQQNNFEKTVESGEKLLAIDPKDLPSLLTLASILPERLPTDEAARNEQLDKAQGYAQRAVVEINALQKPAGSPMSDEQWTTEKNRLLASVYSSTGLIFLNKKDYPKSVEQYTLATNLSRTNPIDFYRLGIAYTFMARGTAKELNDLVTNINSLQTELQSVSDPAAKDEKEKKLAELKVKQGEDEKKFPELRDKGIDALAKSVALKGATEKQARTELERLYKSKNNNSLDGIDAVIQKAADDLKKPAQ
ncbi:MAG: hypothetical protein U0V70_17180 [Terriglobia bacterium]